jgi:hypothetical protein
MLEGTFRPRLYPIVTKFLQGRRGLLISDTDQAVRESSPMGGLHIAGCSVIALPRGFPHQCSVPHELVPIDSASFKNRHFPLSGKNFNESATPKHLLLAPLLLELFMVHAVVLPISRSWSYEVGNIPEPFDDASLSILERRESGFLDSELNRIAGEKSEHITTFDI